MYIYIYIYIYIYKFVYLFLDKIIYIKPRDKFLISKYFWKFNTGIINKKYPIIYNVEDWPAVKSGVISKENGIYIIKIFDTVNNKFFEYKFIKE